MLVKLLQPKNALSYIVFTLYGIVALFKFLLSLNAQTDISFTPFGIVYDVLLFFTGY